MAQQPKGELVVVTQGFDYAPLETLVAERVRLSWASRRSTEGGGHVV